MKEATIEKIDDHRFKVNGDMTFNTTQALLSASKQLFAQAKELNLNLSGVNNADSAGLALLLEWIAEIEKKGGKVSLEGIPAPIRTMAKLCQIESTIEKNES